MDIHDVHIFQCVNQIICGDMGSLAIQLCFQQAVHKEGGIADQEMDLDSVWITVVDRSCGKVGFQDPETIFDL